MLNSGMLLKIAITTMVVGRDQTLVGDNLTCAEMPERRPFVAKTDNGVFEAALVYAVDVFGGQFKTSFLHVSIVFANEREKPHTLIGLYNTRQSHEHSQGQYKCFDFHFRYYY